MEFTVYNANVNLFCCVTLTLETSGLGESHLSWKASPWLPTPHSWVLLPQGLGSMEVVVEVWVHLVMGHDLWVPDSKASVVPQLTVLSDIILRESSGVRR